MGVKSFERKKDPVEKKLASRDEGTNLVCFYIEVEDFKMLVLQNAPEYISCFVFCPLAVLILYMQEVLSKKRKI